MEVFKQYDQNRGIAHVLALKLKGSFFIPFPFPFFFFSSFWFSVVVLFLFLHQKTSQNKIVKWWFLKSNSGDPVQRSLNSRSESTSNQLTISLFKKFEKSKKKKVESSIYLNHFLSSSSPPHFFQSKTTTNHQIHINNSMDPIWRLKSARLWSSKMPSQKSSFWQVKSWKTRSPSSFPSSNQKRPSW